MTARFVRVAVFALLLAAAPAWSADHEDSPAVRTDPTTDFGDVFAWTSADASRVNLIGTFVRRATRASRFSDAAVYVFHTQNSAVFGAGPSPERNVECTFDGVDVQTVTCVVAGEVTVSGVASAAEGITSADGRVRVFAGLRNDAFFFNSDGFNATRQAVIAASGGLTFDPAGCPQLDGATATALATQLTRGTGGAPPIDNFGRANILVLALSIDKSLLVRAGTPILSVYGSTRRR